jgi:hypothetical protein
VDAVAIVVAVTLLLLMLLLLLLPFRASDDYTFCHAPR